MTGEHAATPPRGAASKAVMPTSNSSSSSEESTLKTVDIDPTKTKTKISPTSPRIKAVIDRSKQNAQRLITSSSHFIENNRWLLPVKFILSFPSHWPRTWVLLVGVLVPLWALICISMAFGSLLAQLELPSEVERNDAILRAEAMIAHYAINATFLLNAPTFCLALWKLKVLGESVDGAEFLHKTPISLLTNETLLDITENEITAALLNVTDPDGDGFILINQTLLQTSLADCAPIYSPMFDAYRKAQNENPEASDSLSFNWIRCWDSDKHGKPNRVFFPTKDQIHAAHPMNQSKAFRQEWNDTQQDLYANLLPQNPTVEQQSLAFEQSLQGATGALVCDENMGGTTWFFFTIMTTLGYGNQAPTTSHGRLLVVSGGLLCIIFFGAVLGLCGYVILAIFDDMVDRVWCAKFLSIPIVGMVFWGAVWLLYALTIAADVQRWWTERLPEFGNDVSREDALWFAFISTSTIGLGDFFLQPEVLFATDSLKYSGLFMIGFVLLSNFFGKIAETIGGILPKQHNSLESRLKNTRVLACWPHGFMPWEKKPTGEVGGELEVFEMDPDDQALVYRIDQLSQLKPDPPLEGEGQPERGFMSSMKGISTFSVNVELLEREESLLGEWLAVVQQQKARALAHRERQAYLVEALSEEAALAEEGTHSDKIIEDESHPMSENQETPLKHPSTVNDETTEDGAAGRNGPPDTTLATQGGFD